MGSDSDLRVMSAAAKVCEDFGVEYEILVRSAHRSPEGAAEYSKTARERGLKVIIAGAGGAAHLAGVMAALSTLPVIGVPINSGALHGEDSLFSTVQMPPGIPVATVAIDAAKNAGLLAMQILGVTDERIAQKLADFKKALTEDQLQKTDKLKTIGYKKYLEEKK